jgi:integrase
MRQAGEGTIFERAHTHVKSCKPGCKKTIWIGAVQRSGKRHLVSAHTAAKVREKLRKLCERLDKGEVPTRDERVSVERYLQEWLEAKAASGAIRRSTRLMYERMIRVHIAPPLRAVELRKLSSRDIEERLFEAMRREGASPRLQQIAFGVLRNALRKAKRVKTSSGTPLIDHNPCDGVDGPAVPQFEGAAMTIEQRNAFLAAAQASKKHRRLAALFELALSTGMRQGELLALTWHDLHLDHTENGIARPYLEIRKTLVEAESTGDAKRPLVLGDPKTEKSRRRMELSERDVKLLKAHWELMRSERNRRSRRSVDGKVVELFPSGLVFCNRNGAALRRDNLRCRAFDRILKDAGLRCDCKRDRKCDPCTRAVKLPHFRFHDLRATYATLASLAGVPIEVIAERLGHSTPRLTLERYARSTPEKQRDALVKYEALIR